MKFQTSPKFLPSIILLFILLGVAGCASVSTVSSSQAFGQASGQIIQIDRSSAVGSASDKQQKGDVKKTKATREKIPTRQANVKSWFVKGRIGIQTAKGGESASFYWRQQKGRYTMQLIAPLGAGSAKISGRPGHITLQTTKPPKINSASTAEKLLQQRFGWSLPISSLYYWIRGLPSPKTRSKTRRGKNKSVSSIMQQGWMIRYLQYAKIGKLALPTKLIILRPKLRIKIIISEWKI